MTKDEAIQRVQELAADRGGKLSFDQFVQEMGIPAQRLRQEVWFDGWNALLRDSGVQTSSFGIARTPDENVIKSVAELIKKLGRWPTQDHYARAKKSDREFPSVRVISRVKKSGKLIAGLVEYSPADPTYETVRTLAAAQPRSEESNESLDHQERVQGFVYMLRYDQKYKIGCTKSLVRRFREVRIELPGETKLIHAIETDDPRGIEEYWHNRFVKKRVRDTEWFTLNADDIRAFKRRKYQ